MDRFIIDAETIRLLRWRKELRDIFAHRSPKTLAAWMREKRAEVVASEKNLLGREVRLRAAPPKGRFPRLVISND